MEGWRNDFGEVNHLTLFLEGWKDGKPPLYLLVGGVCNPDVEGMKGWRAIPNLTRF